MGKCSTLFLCLAGLVGGIFAAIPQVEVTKEVTGNCEQQAKDGDNMTVYYEGSFRNGTLFDSTTLVFILGDPWLVKGWNIGLQDACLGDELLLMIPYSLGYGDTGSPPVIPPNTDLFFKIHVLKINGNEAMPADSGKSIGGNETDAMTNATRVGGHSNVTGNLDDDDDDYDDDDDDDEEGNPQPYDPSGLFYKLQFLAIPVAVILFVIVAYCIYTIEYPDRKIKFYRVRDHDFDGGLNRVI